MGYRKRKARFFLLLLFFFGSLGWLWSYLFIRPLQRDQMGELRRKGRTFTRPTHKRQFVVLLWTQIYGKNPSLESFCLKNITTNCEFTNCFPTADRKSLFRADVVLFHGRDLKKEDLPNWRRSMQYWTYFMVESQVHSWVDLKPFGSLFNWTMSYRRDSDVYTPYGKILRRKKPKNLNYIFSKIKDTRKLGAIARSNCAYEHSGRKNFLKKLSKFIQIDEFGNCGKKKCPRAPDDYCDSNSCYSYIGQRYKFYFAFENSVCRDYVTEKVFASLANGMVPVVLGGGNYSAILPKNSFIDATLFPTASSLAHHLLQLDQNPDAYAELSKWRINYVADSSPVFSSAFCSLCKKLNENYGKMKVVDDLADWWYKDVPGRKPSMCVKEKDLKLNWV